MATLKQLEKLNGGQFHNSDEFYCLAYCPRCGKETEPYNGQFLFQREDGSWFCPVKEGHTDMSFESVWWGSFGAACARRVLAAGGVFEKVKQF